MRKEVCGGVVTFDVNITPGESSYFIVNPSTKYKFTNNGGKDHNDLVSDVRWVIDVDAPEKPTSSDSDPLPRDILSIKHQYKPQDPGEGLATRHSDEDGENTGKWKDNETDPIPGPHPAIWHRRPVATDEPLAVDAYDTKLCTSNIKEYRWSLFRKSTDEEEKQCRDVGGESCEWFELVPEKSTNKPEYVFPGEKISKKDTQYKIKLTAVPENDYSDTEYVSEEPRTVESIFVPDEGPGAMLSTTDKEIISGQDTEFTLTKKIRNGDVDSWTLDFGDGNSTSGENFKNPDAPVDYITKSHTYEKSGEYKAKLTTKYGNATYTDSVSITVNPIHVTANPEAVKTGKEINFSINGKGFDRYEWYFGDDSDPEETNNAQNSHTYTSSGDYEVKVKAYKSGEKKATDSVKVSVVDGGDGSGNISVSINAESNEVPVKEVVSFTAENQGDLKVDKYKWDFNPDNDSDDTTTSSSEVTHTYSNAGEYKVEVKAEAKNSDKTSTATTTIKVNPKSSDKKPPSVSIEGPDRLSFRNKASYWAVANDKEMDGKFDYKWQLIGPSKKKKLGSGKTKKVYFEPKLWSPVKWKVVVEVTDDEGETTKATKEVTVM